MKKITFYGYLFTILFILTSCELAKGIFKAGIWVGVIGVLLVVGLVLWLISKIK